MRTHSAKSNSSRLIVLALLVIQLFAFSASFASITISVNGQANGASFAQGSLFSWNIQGLPPGASVFNELWVDINSNGVIDNTTDFLFIGFPQTDGVAGNNDGPPGDDDATANGTITSSITGLYFPVTYYVFKTKIGNDSATSAYQLTPLVGPTFTVSGRVTQNSVGKANVTVSMEADGNGQFWSITNSTGNYSITTNLPPGTNVRVNVPFEGFNSNLSGLIPSPRDISFSLTSNTNNVNFSLTPGKIVTGLVTDTIGNPIADMKIDIYPASGGGNGYDGRTDGNGRYYVTVDAGTYAVRFGDDQETKGFIKTYYNQKYIGYMADNIYVSPTTDTLKNINAVLRRGGLIMGTFIENGMPARGSISAWAFNTNTNPLYETWHDDRDNFYYLVVPPGTYTIQFRLEGANQQEAFYNQSIFWPGAPVSISSFTDTAKNINVNFSALPKKYTFFGWGDWSNNSNWQNFSRPPSILPAGDFIIIQGGCTLSSNQIISPGAYLIVTPGANLQVTGSLIRQ